MQGVYEIEWRGESFEARYVGIRKLESAKRNWLAIRSFEINPVEECDYGWDANPFTFYTSAAPLKVAVEKGKTEATLLLGEVAEGAYVEMLNKKGKVLGRIEISAPHTRFELVKKTAYLNIYNPKGGLYEVILK